MNINYLKGPGKEPGTWLVYLLAECPEWGHPLMCAQGCVGLGREGTGRASRWRPLLEESALAVTLGSPLALARPATQRSWLQGAHLSLRMGPRVPCGLAPGWVCAASLPCLAITSLWCHGKRSGLQRPRSPGPGPPLPQIMLCDLGSSPHFSGPWGVSCRS